MVKKYNRLIIDISIVFAAITALFLAYACLYSVRAEEENNYDKLKKEYNTGNSKIYMYDPFGFWEGPRYGYFDYDTEDVYYVYNENTQKTEEKHYIKFVYYTSGGVRHEEICTVSPDDNTKMTFNNAKKYKNKTGQTANNQVIENAGIRLSNQEQEQIQLEPKSTIDISNNGIVRSAYTGQFPDEYIKAHNNNMLDKGTIYVFQDANGSAFTAEDVVTLEMKDAMELTNYSIFIAPKDGITKEEWKEFCQTIAGNPNDTGYTREFLERYCYIYDSEIYDKLGIVGDVSGIAEQQGRSWALKTEYGKMVETDYGEQFVVEEGSLSAQDIQEGVKEETNKVLEGRGDEGEHISIDTTTEAGEPDIINIRETKEIADNFLKSGSEGHEDKTISSGIDQNMMKKTVNSLNKVLITIGIVVAIIIGLILGIKFVMGGIEEKAEIKGMLVPYVVGVVVLFAAYAIWSLVVNLLQNNI